VHNHRPIAGDSAAVEAVKILARAHQNLIWSRTRQTNSLRSALREYYPAALVAFEDLHDRDTLAILGRAPSPEQGARLSLSAIRSALKHAGRQRNLDVRARDIQATLRAGQLAAPAPITAAFAATTTAAAGASPLFAESKFGSSSDKNVYHWRLPSCSQFVYRL